MCIYETTTTILITQNAFISMFSRASCRQAHWPTRRLGQTLICFLSPQFCFCQNFIYLWNHSVQHPMNGASMDNMEIGEEKLSKEKAMEPHSSTLAWKLPWMREPGRLRSMGSLRVWHNWATSLSLFTFMHWRRKWQPIPVFLPGESQGRGSLVGCYLWGRTELDTTEAT